MDWFIAFMILFPFMVLRAFWDIWKDVSDLRRRIGRLELLELRITKPEDRE